MKKTFTLLLMFFGLFSLLNAQTALDPNEFVNTQITEAGVYTVEAGQAYAFDGRIDLDFEITIEGPDNGWILEADNPPIFVNTPAADGAARDFFSIKEGGAITVKNILWSGKHSNDEVISIFIANAGGSKVIVDNCAFTDWVDFALRNQFKGEKFSITNSVFINGVRLGFSPWGGFPLRMDVACDSVLLENNSVVNSGRLLGNSGPWQNARVHELHNTYVNQTVAGHEQRALEMLQANNIFYNFHFYGRRTENHSQGASNTYDASFTTWNYFADSKEHLDSISLYLGHNLLYREQEILDWFETVGGDSIAPSLLWEHPDVDSFITIDDNYTIDANYWQIDPEFTTHPGNTQEIVGVIDANWANPQKEWVDWRITSPVTFDGDGFPVLSWPPAFDLSYANEGLQTAGTDGLPLGDLNWFPDKKAEYLADRDNIVAGIMDLMANPVDPYDPTTMDSTTLITEITELPDIVQIVIDSPDHDTLEAAVVAAGLVETLQGEGPFTLFAPTDDAFAALPEGALDDLLADPTGGLADVLKYHVVAAKAMSTDLSDGQVITTVLGKDVTVTINDDGVFINDAKVTVADIEASNGVVHVIDAVMLPPTNVEKNNAVSLKLYPNPVDNQLMVQYTDIEQIVIRDILGKAVRTLELSGVDQTTINTEDLTNGIYFISVKTSSKNLTARFVKK